MSPPSTPGPEECTRVARAEAIEYFEKLIKEGARPPKALQLEPGPYDPEYSDEELHPLGHFTFETIQFMQALDRWREFRKWQKAWRKTPEHFTKLQNNIRSWREERGFLDETVLSLLPECQTKLTEWKEYHGYQQSRVKKWERKFSAAKRAFELVREKMNAGHPCWEEFSGHESYLSFTKRKYEEAGPVLEWIEQELPVVVAESGSEEPKQLASVSDKV